MATVPCITEKTAYPIDVFREIVGWGPAALREAKKRGFRPRYLGKRAFVRGEDFLKYLDEHGRDERGADQPAA